jgi:ATP/ADP translocase
MRSLLRVTEGGLKSSIHRANWEQTYLPLDRATRVIAKLLVDGAGARVAEGLGAIIIVVWLRLAVQKGALMGGDTRWITWLLLVTILMWLVLTRFLNRNLTLQGVSKEALSEMRAELPIPDS